MAQNVLFRPTAATQLHGGERPPLTIPVTVPKSTARFCPVCHHQGSTALQTDRQGAHSVLTAMTGPACCPHPFPPTEPACSVWLPCPSFTLTQGLAPSLRPIPRVTPFALMAPSVSSACSPWCNNALSYASSTHSISSSNCFRPLTAVLRKPGQRPCLLHWG